MTPRKVRVFGLAALIGLLICAPRAFADKHKKKSKKKADAYATSKYKAYRVLTDDNHSYRFDSKGNPIRPRKEKASKQSGERKKFTPPKLDSGGSQPPPPPSGQ